MPRGPGQKRAVTENDLSDTQRRIYHALPEDLRRQYIAELPRISVSSAGRRRKAQMIRDRIVMLDSVLSGLQDHRKQLTALAKGLDQGAVNAESVDLRQELKPPAISGISMRYVRPRRRA